MYTILIVITTIHWLVILCCVDLLMSWDINLFNVVILVYDFLSWLLCNPCCLVFSAGRVIVHNL